MNCQNRYNYFCIKLLSFGVIILLISSTLLHAQISDLEAEKVFSKSLAIQKSGMITLGSWAVLQILTGSLGYYSAEKSDWKYFHQMNAAWNLVNLGIAGFGYYGATHPDRELSASGMFSEMKRFDNILLINAGLDVLYIGTGAYLWNRGIKNDNPRLVGYWKSIILQGSFLLAFDTALYLIHSPLSHSFADGSTLSFTGNSVRLEF